MPKNENTHPIHHFIAGGTGGLVGIIFTSPLELIKTRLQALEHRNNIEESRKERFFGARTFDSLKEIHQKEGLKGLWRGIGPNMIAVVPSRAVYFGTYGFAKKTLNQMVEEKDGTAVVVGSGIIAGSVVVTAMNPIWLIKTRMQLQNSQNIKYTNSFDCIKKVYQTEGWTGFYRGLSASYVGIAESTMHFFLYEKAKSQLIEYKRKKQNEAQRKGSDKTFEVNGFEYFAMASVCKLAASVSTYPHEVVRTRLREQTQVQPNDRKYKSLLHCFQKILAEEGTAGLYGGMGAHLLRVVPNSAIMFMVYELVLKVLEKNK